MTIKYALVSNEIISYVDGTVTRVPNQWVPGVFDICWKDSRGLDCVTPEDNFQEGTYEELVQIIRAQQEAIEQDIQRVIDASFTDASSNQKAVIRLLICDGQDPEYITEEFVNNVLRGMSRLYDVCNSLEEAYMCYMH